MNGKSHTIRRMLTAVALSAAASLFVVPLAQAMLDGPYHGIPAKQSATQSVKANDHILDVSARDAGVVPSGLQGSRTDFMYRDSQLSSQTAAAQANDHVLDVSAREAGPAPVEEITSSGTDWQRIGIGVAAGLGGVLLLAGLVLGIVEVRHTRHRLGSA